MRSTQEILQRAAAAARSLSTRTTRQKNTALEAMACALEAQTPFTLRGAAEQKRLGILILCISPATMVLRVALSAAFSAEFMPERLAGMIVADGGMLALGVMFLVLSLVCRYGAEREAMKQE